MDETLLQGLTKITPDTSSVDPMSERVSVSLSISISVSISISISISPITTTTITSSSSISISISISIGIGVSVSVNLSVSLEGPPGPPKIPKIRFVGNLRFPIDFLLCEFIFSALWGGGHGWAPEMRQLHNFEPQGPRTSKPPQTFDKKSHRQPNRRHEPPKGLPYLEAHPAKVREGCRFWTGAHTTYNKARISCETSVKNCDLTSPSISASA